MFTTSARGSQNNFSFLRVCIGCWLIVSHIILILIGFFRNIVDYSLKQSKVSSNCARHGIIIYSLFAVKVFLEYVGKTKALRPIRKFSTFS